MPRHRKKIIDPWSAIGVLLLAALEIAIWRSISSSVTDDVPTISFLSVSQGEAVLAEFPRRVSIMTDAGPDDGVVGELQKIMPGPDDYIDLAIISYPQAADYGGYNYLLDHYNVGAFLYDGRNDDANANEWQALVEKIASKRIPLITLGVGDSIHYGNNEIDILAPDKDFSHSPESSDAVIVQRVITSQFRALLASDIGTNGQAFLLSQNQDIHANILKAIFPTSSSAVDSAFLRAVNPNVLVITPGVKNTPSQSLKTTPKLLASSTKALILDTAQSGTTEIVPVHGAFLLYNK